MSDALDQLEEPTSFLRQLADEGRIQDLVDAVTEFDLHPSDVADLIEGLEVEEQRTLVRTLPIELASEALAEMEDGDERDELLASLDVGKTAAILHELADDDAADLIGDLEPSEQDRILAALPAEEAVEIRELLAYDEESAGGLMTTDLVSISDVLTAEEAIAEVRRQGREVEDFYSIFVIDGASRLLGTVGLDDLILADPQLSVSDLVEEAPVQVPAEMDQEDVGRLLSRYNLVSVPVVTTDGQLLGRITFDDVIDVIEAEQTEDILRLAGVSDDEEVRADWREAIRTRLPWLALNLVTISIASSVVLGFEALFENAYYLAMLMPIVAGMGGNAGTQALAVTVRRIALTDGLLEQKSDAVSKELLVGLANGLSLGVLAAIVVWVVTFVNPALPPALPLVVMGALWANILLSGFVGAFIPTVLDRFGIDPAVASSIFLTTFTDLVGFLLLLSLASALLGL